MQYWLYANKINQDNILIAKCNTLEQAKTKMDKLDMKKYDHANIVKIEHGKTPEYICSMGKIGGVKK